LGHLEVSKFFEKKIYKPKKKAEKRKKKYLKDFENLETVI
jgi:hypothetical protein